MSDTLLRWLLRAALCTFVIGAQAQGSTHAASPAARPDPLDAKARVPAPDHRSAFARYRAFDDDKPLSWREANEAVARIGGWRAYAREAQQPEAKPAGTPAPSSPQPTDTDAARPMPPGHGRHPSP